MARATVAGLAKAKSLPEKYLRKVGLTEDSRGVVIPYRNMDGTAARPHIRHNLESAQPCTWGEPTGGDIGVLGAHRVLALRERDATALTIAEGDTDWLTLTYHRIAAVGIPGATNHGRLTAEMVEGWTEIRVATDNDTAGEKSAIETARHLRRLGYARRIVRVSPAPYKDVNEMHLACNGTFKAEWARRVDEAPEIVVPIETPKGKSGVNAGFRLVTRRLSEIEAKPIEWFWYGRLVKNEPGMIAGPPGVGKSMVAGAIVAAITTGTALPGGGDVTKPGDVLILALEDDAGRVLRRRYESMGADLKRVHIIEGVAAEGERVAPFTLSHIEAMERALDGLPEVVAIFIDPVSGMMGGADTHRSNEVRERLDPFLELMSRRGITTVFVTHTNKSVSLMGAARIEGSIGGFVGRARSVLGVGRDPASGIHGVGVLKTNYGRMDFPVIGFEIGESGKFTWLPDALAISASELFEQSQSYEQQSEADEARESILGALADGEKTAEELAKATKRDGVSDITFRRMRSQLKREKFIRRSGGGVHGPIRWALEASPEILSGSLYPLRLKNNDEPDGKLGHPTLMPPAPANPVRLIHKHEPEGVLMSRTGFWEPSIPVADGLDF